jgi:hypothetical protein
MLLIERATEGNFILESGDREIHQEYKIQIVEAKQPQTKRALKSKTSLHVKPLFKRLHN